MDFFKRIIKSSSSVEPVKVPEDNEIDICDLFPIVKIPESSLQHYKKIPTTGLAALGTAFAQLPEAARTIVQTTTSQIATNDKLFVGINPKGISGFLPQDQYGTVGNIMQFNEQGKQIIAGRMRFKPINSLSVNETTSSVIPFNPTLMVVAVAVMAIEQKMDKIQSSVEEILRFLELEKQAKQRGNLRKLSEISDDYKTKCEDKEFCANRNIIVQTIQVAALQDIEFYQEKIGIELQKQKTLHLNKDASALKDSASHEFAEYQLACYLYAYSCFMDVMLRRDFSKVTLDNTTEKLTKMSSRYNTLFSDCCSQIEQYNHNAIEAKVVGGISLAAKGLGKAIGSIPVIKDGSVDEALINAGNSLEKRNRESASNKLASLSSFEDNRMTAFIDNISSINLMYNTDNSMLTDGENIYVIDKL